MQARRSERRKLRTTCNRPPRRHARRPAAAWHIDERNFMKKPVRRFATLVLAGCIAASNVIAQQIVYPAKGQSAEQQKKDEYDCHQWAVQKTGVDPTKP